MHATPAHDPVTEDQVRRAVVHLYERARIILGDQCEATPMGVTSWYLDTLRGVTDATVNELHALALEIRDTLLDPSTTDDVDWWGTSLGRALVWHGVGPREGGLQLSQSFIAAVLGCTRQNAAKTLRRFERLGRTYEINDLTDALHVRWGKGMTEEAA